jgi:hypothetical protein
VLKGGARAERRLNGVYQVIAEGTYRTSAWTGEPDDPGRYKYGTAPVAYLNRRRLYAINQRHEALATPPQERIAPGKLYTRLAPGQHPAVDPEQARLLHSARDVLEWSRAEFAANFQTSPYMIKHWELTTPGYRIPHGIWPALVDVLRFQRNTRATQIADEIEATAMGGAPKPRPAPIEPSTATPVPMEAVRAIGKEALGRIAGRTTSRYMRGAKEEQAKRADEHAAKLSDDAA